MAEESKCALCGHRLMDHDRVVNGHSGKCQDCECVLSIESWTSQPTSTTGEQIDPEGVDHPVHYNLHPSGVECIEIIRHHNLDVGSAIKYLWRQGLKDGEPSIKDLKKAIWYIQDEIARLEKEKTK